MKILMKIKSDVFLCSPLSINDRNEFKSTSGMRATENQRLLRPTDLHKNSHPSNIKMDIHLAFHKT